MHRQYQISFWVSNVFCQYLAKAKMAHAIAKRRIIEEDLYECGLDVHHYLFFVCASILRMIRIISAQNMSLNVLSEIDSSENNNAGHFLDKSLLICKKSWFGSVPRGCSFLIVPLVSFSTFHVCFQEHFFISQVVIFIILRVSSGCFFLLFPAISSILPSSPCEPEK